MTHITNRTWKPEDIAELRMMAEKGLSPARAAARFKRSITSVQVKAKREGFPFQDSRIVKRQRAAREAEARKSLGLPAI